VECATSRPVLKGRTVICTPFCERNAAVPEQNLGTLAEAQAIAPVSRPTFSAWVKNGWIRAVRVGPRKTLYDLDSVRAMVRPIGKLTDEERAAISELVATSPDPSDEQISAVRAIIHGASAG
jgi:hypothetical protein